VLSVDDDPVNQLVAGTALRSHKWEVVKSMSGAEVSMSVADVSRVELR
jgi:CheY-like chemotaxis protein